MKCQYPPEAYTALTAMNRAIWRLEILVKEKLPGESDDPTDNERYEMMRTAASEAVTVGYNVIDTLYSCGIDKHEGAESIDEAFALLAKGELTPKKRAA